MSKIYNKHIDQVVRTIDSVQPTFGQEKTKEFKKKLEIKNRNKSSKDMFKKKQDLAKGGRVGRKGGGDLGMQSVKYGLDNKPEITKLDRIAKFVAKNKKKKFQSPMAKAVKKKDKKKVIV
jgi:hypothetical protein